MKRFCLSLAVLRLWACSQTPATTVEMSKDTLLDKIKGGRAL